MKAMSLLVQAGLIAALITLLEVSGHP